MALPTKEEINVHNSLDERSACEHFLGKTLEEAESLFRENALRHQEDLMWMGPVAFCYYVPAYVHYLESPDSNGDSDAVSCFIGLLEFRLKYCRDHLLPIAPLLRDACRRILTDFNRFDASAEIYGDIRTRCDRLISTL